MGLCITPHTSGTGTLLLELLIIIMDMIIPLDPCMALWLLSTRSERSAASLALLASLPGHGEKLVCGRREPRGEETPLFHTNE